jgi:hypothetical protein
MFDTSQTGPAGTAAAQEWADCSGAVLGLLVARGLADLEELPDSVEGDTQALDLATATMRVEAWTVAARAKAVAQVYARSLAEHQRFGTARASHAYDSQAFTRSEVAANLSLELGISLSAADTEVRFALVLAEHPRLAVALATGRLHAAQARAIASELRCVTQMWVQRRIVTALVGDPQDALDRSRLAPELRRAGVRIWSLPSSKLKAMIRRTAADLDPDSVAARAKRAHDARHIRYYGGPDNMAELVIHGPAEMLAAVIARIDAAAITAKSAGATGTMDQIRHDLTVGTLTDGLFGLEIDAGAGHPATSDKGRNSRRPSRTPTRTGAILVNVTVSDTTLAGGSQPAVLHGPDGDTPLPADLARELAYDADNAIWRQVRCDPATGQASAISETYRPSKRLREFVAYRDGYTSRFPTSTVRRRIELDHVVEFDHVDPANGGPTNSANLASEGLREHRLKTDRGFFISGDADGCLTFQTRTGRTYHSWPHQHMRPIPELDLDRLPPERDPAPPTDYGDPPF